MSENLYYVKYKKIDDLRVNELLINDIYSSKGELLYFKNHHLTEDNIKLLRSRYDTHVFLESEVPDVEAKKSKEYVDFGDINPEVSDEIPIANREIENIPFGKEGLNILIESDFIKYLNKLQLRDSKVYIPTDLTFKNSLKDLTSAQRTNDYKNFINDNYSINLLNYRQILKSIANGKTRNVDKLYGIVKFFISILKRDKSMLINLSSSTLLEGEYIFVHSYNVCILSIGFAAHLGYDEKSIADIAISALLADIGMLFISDKIRSKNEMLNNREWYEVKKHPLLSVEICRKLNNLPKVVLFAILQAHERINGSGYPQGLSNIMLHSYTKLIQVADIYHSLISDRPYRAGYTPFEAIEMLLKLSQNRTLEKKVVVGFIQYISIFPLGTLVKLNDKRIGKVIAINNEDMKRPKLLIVIDSTGKQIEKEKSYIFDLAKNKTISIEQSISVSFFNNLNVMDGF